MYHTFPEIQVEIKKFLYFFDSVSARIEKLGNSLFSDRSEKSEEKIRTVLFVLRKVVVNGLHHEVKSPKQTFL